jgi:protein tyrosine phosphatase
MIKHDSGNFHMASINFSFPSMNHLLEYYKNSPLVDNYSRSTVKLVEPLCDTAERLSSLARQKREFELLQQEDRANTNTKIEGSKLCNKTKNRYKNILPFDHTRVSLRDADPRVEGSDYINASYIFDDEGGSQLFIAAQGCMKQTVQAFWEMTFQENTRIIIMVTNEVEKAKIKCVRYWPELNKSITAGNLSISNTGEKSTRDYIVRQLEIQEVNSRSPARQLYHYQCIGWPDHGTPKEPGAILEMLQLIEATQKTFEYPGPIVVHCSAGIGRTGTVIVIQMLMNLLQSKGHLEERDVPRTVQRVRLQRSGMVQTEAQYHFIYQSIIYYLETLTTRNEKSANVISSH